MGRVPAQSRRERRHDPFAVLLRVALKGAATVTIALLVMTVSTRLLSADDRGAGLEPIFVPHIAAKNPGEACGRATNVDPAFLPWRADNCIEAAILVK